MCLRIDVGYNLFLTAARYPEDCVHLRVALEFEHQQLLSWGDKVGYLSEEAGLPGLRRALKNDQLVLHSLLSNIRTTMDDFVDLHAFYKDLDPSLNREQQLAAQNIDIAEEAHSLKLSYEKNARARKHLRGLNHLIHGLGTVKDVIAQPRRLVWAAVGKHHFEDLLGKLSKCRASLYDWMDDHIQLAILENTRSANLEMLEVRKDISELRHFLEALTFLNRQQSIDGSTDASSSITRVDLEGLTRFKISNEEYIQDRGRIDRETHHVEKDRKQVQSVTMIDEFRVSAKLVEDPEQSVDVWIEWRAYSRENYEDNDGIIVHGIPPSVVGRMRELVSLLRFEQPSELCLPTCLGYFDDYEEIEKEQRYGIIYARPYGIGQITQRSLFTLLKNLAQPSLTDRIQLSRNITSCLLYLHTVNWIHKDLRSESIIFYKEEGQKFTFSQPIISGFDHSRPDQEGTVTTSIKLRPRNELYKHPLNQGKVPKEHGCKVFDIYALGLILLEVAYWMPLEKILDLEWAVNEPEGLAGATALSEGHVARKGFEARRATAFQEVRERLLATEPQHLEKLEAMAGTQLTMMVRTCLGGPESFGITSHRTKKDREASRILQMNYTEHVVRAAKRIVV